MEIRKVESVKAISKRVRCSLQEIAQAMGQAYGEIAQKAGPTLAGAPYVIYFNEDMNDLDMELGFPTTAGEAPEGLDLTTIPAGEVATAKHIGPYDKLEDTYVKLMSFIAEQGRDKDSWMYEWYLNDPAEVSPEELVTEVMIPLK